VTLGNAIKSFLNSAAGQRVTRFYLSMHSWIEEQHRKDVGFYEKLYREDFFAKSFRFLSFNNVEGDYLEFGCHQGVTFTIAHKYKHISHLNMKLFGFDSFQGLPKPEGIDVHEQWKENLYAMGMQELTNKLQKSAVAPSEYTLIPGFYNESLKTNPPNKFGLKKAALVYIDCDLYESTVPVLNYIVPLLQTGTVVAFDDFYCFNGDPDRGEQRALKEFLQTNPKIKMNDYLNIGWGGKSFITKVYT
jgi:O-methyltransferase